MDRISSQDKYESGGRFYGSTLAFNRLLPSILFLSLWILCAPAKALDPQVQFRQYVAQAPALKRDDDGIPTDIVQDKTGFLWIGKTNGLVRFDGISRQYYEVAEYPDLNSNFVKRLYVDSDGRLIVITDIGVSVLAQNDINLLALNPSADKHMNTVLQNPDGELVFGGNSGLFYIVDGSFVSLVPELEGRAVYSLRWFDDAMWIGGDEHLWSLRNGVVREHALPKDLSRQSIWDLEIYRGQLWLGTSAGVWTLTNDTLVPLAQLSRTTDIRILLPDRHGSLWFGGAESAGRLLSEGSVEFITFDDEEIGFRTHIRSFLEDVNGHFWIVREGGEVVGTSDSSVIRLSVSEGLPLARVNTIATTLNGTPLIGHDLGVLQANRKTATPILDSQIHKHAAGVTTVLHTSEQRLWVGSKSGVAIFTEDGTDLTPEQLRRGIGSTVLALLEQKPGLVWIGTSDGLYKWENNNLARVSQLQEKRIETMHSGPDGRLWIGTNSGLYKLKNDGFIPATNLVIPQMATITSITSLPDGQIAASVRDRGILVGRSNDWRLLTTSNGLPKDSPFFLGVAPDGYLWGVTSSGVYRVPAAMLANSSVEQFSIQTVLSTRSRYRPEIDAACCYGGNSSAASIHENMLYVAGNDGGILYVDTFNPREELATPVAYVERMSQNPSGGWQDIDGEINLNSQERYLRLRFSAVQLMNGSNVRFRYRLGGESSTWTEVGRDTVAVLSNLPPGKQLFELQASVRDNEWSDSSEPLWITRQPGFVETRYFYLLIVLGLIAIYASLIWVRARWLRRRVDHIEALIHQRTTELRDVNDNLNEANENLTKVSHTDVLTGLHNRRYLEANKHKLGLQDTQIEDNNVNTALVLLDIDFFKRINDEYGHVTGDAILQQFSDLLNSFVRANDEVIRWGGEEFLMLLRFRDAQLPTILERIRQTVRTHNFKSDNGVDLRITISIGAIACPTQALRNHSTRLNDLFQCADMALYSVKKNGRDGWASASADEQQFRIAAKSRQLAQDMHDMIEANTLTWCSSRPELRLNSDSSVVPLSLVQEQ